MSQRKKPFAYQVALADGVTDRQADRVFDYFRDNYTPALVEMAMRGIGTVPPKVFDGLPRRLRTSLVVTATLDKADWQKWAVWFMVQCREQPDLAKYLGPMDAETVLFMEQMHATAIKHGEFRLAESIEDDLAELPPHLRPEGR